MTDINSAKRPLIMISNDDGIQSRGIHALIDYMLPFGDVIVVAPDSPQSAKSSSLTVDNPLRAKQLTDYHGAEMWQVNGTPVDCTKLAYSQLLGRRPDFVVSGINHGSNAGVNAIYSGTMGVVFEACLSGTPAVGFSLLSHKPDADFPDCKEVVERVMRVVIDCGLPKGVCLNVNIPAKQKVQGIKVAAAARGHWSDDFERQTDPHGRDIYWLTGHYELDNPADDSTDMYWLDHGYATVVPCVPDQTAHTLLDSFRNLFGPHNHFTNND